MTFEIVVRQYKDGDLEDYANVLVRTWPLDNVQEARESIQKEVNKTKTDKKNEIWVAEIGGRAVGFITIAFTRFWGNSGESFGNEGVGIDWFDVNPDFQRKGIGKNLIRKTEERGREMKLSMIFMNTSVKNLSAINFASVNGFRFEKYVEDFWGKGTGDAFLLVKDL